MNFSVIAHLQKAATTDSFENLPDSQYPDYGQDEHIIISSNKTIQVLILEKNTHYRFSFH